MDELVLKRGIGLSLKPFLKIPRAIRSIEPGVRWVAAAALLLLLNLIVASWILPREAQWFDSITWEDGSGSMALPRPALYLSLLAWAFSGAAILAGTSQWSLRALAIAGPVELLAIVFTAFPGGKGYLLAAPSWLLPILTSASPLAGRSPRGCRVLAVVFSAMAAWHTHLFTPLSAKGRPPNWILLAGLFVLLAAGSLILAARRRRLTAAGAFLLAFAVNAAVLLVALQGGGETALARGLVIPSSFFVGLFAVLWFVLGGGVVGGGVKSASFAIKLAAYGPRQAVAGVLFALWLAEICLAPWLARRSSPDGAMALSIHQWLAGGLLAIGVGLVLSRRFSGGWARGLIAVWVFGYAVLRAYFSGALAVAGSGEGPGAGTLALTMFVLGIAMQLVNLLIKRSEALLGTPGGGARLLFQLGALAFLAAGTHFQFAIGDTQAMKEAAAYQFAGASALFLPLLLALLVTEERWLAAPPRAALSRAFVIGFAVSFPVQLLRIETLGPGGWSLAGHLGAAALGDALKLGAIAGLILCSRSAGLLESAALAGACALGFGVGYGLDLTVLMLNALAKTALILTYQSSAVSQAFSALVEGYVRFRAALPAADHYFLLIAGLLPAAMFGAAVARGAREGRWGKSLAVMLAAFAVSLALAWAFQVQPLLATSGRRPVPFYDVATDPGALALVLAPVGGLLAWLVLGVWRPERRQSISERPSEAVRSGAAPRPRRLAGAVVVTALALAAGGIGLAVALASPPPFREYRDPQARFSIDIPRTWQVQELESGETRFFDADPQDGPMALVHPGIPLPGPVSPAQLIQRLERQLRDLYQDVEVVPQKSQQRTEDGRLIQEIELALAWTRSGKGRFHGRSELTLVSAPGQTFFSYVSYQVPESAPASLEPLLEGVIRSYRPGSPP